MWWVLGRTGTCGRRPAGEAGPRDCGAVAVAVAFRGVVGVSAEGQSADDSWPSNGTNSVPADNAGETAADGGACLPSVSERVAEFREKYGDRAYTPLSESDGQKLRRDVTEADRVDYEVPLKHGEGTVKQSTEMERHALPWIAAVEQFLDSHQSYRDARLRFGKGRPETPEREEFEVSLDDAWGEAYADREYARAKAIEREMEREWGDDYTTVMLTLTASATPDGDHLPPVDHLRSVLDTWSDKTYHALRNTMRSLGYERDEWCYWLQGEPHPGGGENACYGHIHVAVYVRGEVAEGDFHSVIDAHVNNCEYAEFAAHDYTAEDPEERPISVNGDVDNLGSYMAEYAGNYGGDLLERPVEYLAWGAIYWATNSQRARRSQTANDAVRADACRQRYEDPDAEQDHDHGERVEYDDGRGADIVCAGCGSAWGISQDQTLTEARRGGSTGSEGVTTGASERSGAEASPEDKLRSRWPSARAATMTTEGGEVVGFDRPPDWEAEAVIRGSGEDAEEHHVGGGGVDMVALNLPTDDGRDLWDRPEGAKFRCEVCNFATYESDTMKHHVTNHDGEPAEVVSHDFPGRRSGRGEV